MTGPILRLNCMNLDDSILAQVIASSQRSRLLSQRRWGECFRVPPTVSGWSCSCSCLAVIGPTWSRGAGRRRAAAGRCRGRAQPADEPVTPSFPGRLRSRRSRSFPTLPTTPVRKGSAGYQRPDGRCLALAPRQGRDLGPRFRLQARPAAHDRPTRRSKGRKVIHYLYYRVINHTGKPRMFVPQFSLVTDTGQRLEDAVIPQAIPIIQAREDASIPLLGAVDIMGMIPPEHQGRDRRRRLRRGRLGRGRSQGRPVQHFRPRPLRRPPGRRSPPTASKPIVRYKTLRIDFIRRGDERNLNEKEIQLNDPPYEWVYW